MKRSSTSRAVSISEFKRNPIEALAAANGRPVAVLNGERTPAFYAVTPELMAEMAELCEEASLQDLVHSRLKSVDLAVKVDPDHL